MGDFLLFKLNLKSKSEPKPKPKLHQFILNFIIHLESEYVWAIVLVIRFASFLVWFALLCFELVQLVSLMVLLAHLIWFDGNTKRQFESTDCCLFTTAALYTVDLWNGFLFISAYVGTFFFSFALFSIVSSVCTVCVYYISLCCAVVAYIYNILMICFRNFETLHRENLLRVQQNQEQNKKTDENWKKRKEGQKDTDLYMYKCNSVHRRIRTTPPPDIK